MKYLTLILLTLTACSTQPVKCVQGETYICEINSAEGRLAKLTLPDMTLSEAEHTTSDVIQKLTLDGLLRDDVWYQCNPLGY